MFSGGKYYTLSNLQITMQVFDAFVEGRQRPIVKNADNVDSEGSSMTIKRFAA